MSLYSDIFLLYLYRKIEKNGIKKIWSLCRVHREKHSAKVAIRGIPKKATLPSASRPTFGKVSNFPKCQILALGKVLVFAECRPLGTRQTRRQPPPPRGKFAEALGNPFAECPRSGTRQRPLCRQGLCRVLFAECNPAFAVCSWHSAKTGSPVATVINR